MPPVNPATRAAQAARKLHLLIEGANVLMLISGGRTYAENGRGARQTSAEIGPADLRPLPRQAPDGRTSAYRDRWELGAFGPREIGRAHV